MVVDAWAEVEKENQEPALSRRREAFGLIRRALTYARPYRKLAVLSLVIMTLGAGANLLAPWPLKILVDSVLEDHPLPSVLNPILGSIADDRTSLLIAVVLGGFLVTLLINGLKVIENYVNTSLEQRMVLDFRSDLFQHASRLSLAFHDRSRTGFLMQRINLQSSKVGSVTMTIPQVMQSLLVLVGMVVVILRIDALLTGLALLVLPALYYSFIYYATRVEKQIRAVRGMEGQSLSIVYEAMAMLRVIAAFGREDHEYQRFRAQAEDAVDARIKLTVRQTLFSLAVNGNTAAGTTLVLGVGAYSVLQGNLTIGDLLVVTSYIHAIYSPLQSISTTAGTLQEELIGLKSAFGLLDTEPDIHDAPDAIDLQRARGDVAFENVSFSYEERNETLKDISFQAHVGQLIGLVGPTGAGKSTLVNLIPRFADPQEGRILIDGIDVRQIKIQSLRKQMSLVLQEPLLFSGTIADNIRYGKLDASLDEIKEAARAANAHRFIMQLPKRYETTLGERGATLSGGERQRISIARAFLKDAPIVILDEPTSAVDSKTEEVILAALRRLMIGRTTFMIAHRLSTIRDADTILVIDEGRLVEEGTHKELVERDGLYKQMHQAQSGRGPRKGRKALQQGQKAAQQRNNGSEGSAGSGANGRTEEKSMPLLKKIESQ